MCAGNWLMVFVMNRALGLASVLALASFAQSAGAAAVGISEAAISLTYEGISSGSPGDAAVAGVAGVLRQQTDFDPGGSAVVVDQSSPSAQTSLAPGEEVRADVEGGAAAAGPFTLSAASIYSAAALSATNLTTSELTLMFSLDFDLFSEVSVGDPASELAIAFSYVAIELFENDTDPGTLIFEAKTEADSDFGPLFDGASGSTFPPSSLQFPLTLGPEQSRTFLISAIVDVVGASVAPIPLPAASPLLGFALSLLGAVGIARRRSSRRTPGSHTA